MSIDMSQFYQVFFEEASDHLANMESMLLSIDLSAPDEEELNAIFRAAHSIKGSAGTFGFQDMAEVTHVLETLLDRVRKGETALTEDMVDAFLVAGDVLKNLLAAHKGEEEADREAAEDVCNRLQQLCDGLNDQKQNNHPDSVSKRGDLRLLKVSFVADPAAASDIKVAENMLTELSEFGKTLVMAQPTQNEPDKPWQLIIQTDVDEDTLRAVIEFVGAGDSIYIEEDHEQSDDPSGAYGFFNEVSNSNKAYGFFNKDGESSEFDAAVVVVSQPKLEVATGGVPSDGDGYGFFTDIQPPVVEVLNAVVDQDGDGFGFFGDAPGMPTSQPAASLAIAQVSPPVKVPEVSSLPESAVVAKSEKVSPLAKKAAASPAAKPAGGGDAGSIRVGVEKVDQMINLVGELVITQAMLAQSASKLDPVLYERLLNGLVQLERNTRDLQESVMSIRMMPISMVFSRFPRVVRDLSQKLNKQVELKMIGENTELDKSLIERISDPLTHLVRNSLDHGIESPERRREVGKSPVGTITLKAYHQSGNIVIEVGDDGGGLNRGKILAKAKERGLPVSDSMADQDVWQLIFEAGFSTADQVTEVSGRGVGMDVVKKNIGAMGGRIEIESMTGIGTRISVRLPLTLAILDGMSVGVGKETYIIPLNYVVESLQPTKSMMKSVSGMERLIQVRGEYLPVISLHETFNLRQAITEWENGIMVVLEADGHKAALFVDQLIGQHQVVIKSLEANYRRVGGVAGATIMGDGHVALILDVAALVSASKRMLVAA